MYRGVLFDVDDTLYSVSDVYKGQWSEHVDVLAGLGVSLKELVRVYDAVRETVPHRVILIRTAEILGYGEELAQTLRDLGDRGVPSELPLHPGARGMLEALKNKGVKIGVLTNGDQARQQAKLKALGIDDLIENVLICDGKTTGFKPEEVVFLRASVMLGLNPNEICMVGDRVDNDITPALNLGMGALRLQLGNHKAQKDDSRTLLSSRVPQTVWARLLDLVSSPDRSILNVPAPRRPEERSAGKGLTTKNRTEEPLHIPSTEFSI